MVVVTCPTTQSMHMQDDSLEKIDPNNAGRLVVGA